MHAHISVSAVLSRVAGIYQDEARVLLPSALAVFLPVAVVSEVLVSASAGLAILGLVAQLVASTFYTGMVVGLVADVRDGHRDSSVGSLFAAVAPVLGPLIVAGVLTGLAVAIGLVALVVPGLYVLTIWSVAGPAIILERRRAIEALGRSRALVAGNGRSVFSVIIIVQLVVVVLGFVMQGFGRSGGVVGGIIGGTIANTLAAPLAALAVAVVYFELLDLQGGATAVNAPAAG